MSMSLNSLDIPVALRLAEAPGSTYQALRDDLGISTSTAHKAVYRLSAAGIVKSDRSVNRHALLEFLEHGVRYAFPASPRGERCRGIATAHAARPLADFIVADDAVVWPDARGSVVGDGVEPLYERAVELPQRCPSTYALLTLVDALRIGRTRERKLATECLRERIGYGAKPRE